MEAKRYEQNLKWPLNLLYDYEVVGGFFDAAEDLYGPLETTKTIEKNKSGYL
jgi:hypothetical protein